MMFYSDSYLFIKNILTNKEIYQFEIVIPYSYNTYDSLNINAKLIIYLRDWIFPDKYPNLYNNYYLSCYFKQDYYNKTEKTLLCFQTLLNKPIYFRQLLNKKIKSIVRIRKRQSLFETLDNLDIYMIETTDGMKVKLLTNLIWLNYNIITIKTVVDNPLLD